MFHSHVENLEKRRKSSWCNELVSINGESRCYRASSFYEVIPYFKKIEANNRQHWRIWKTDLWYLPSISMLAVSHASCLDSFQVSNFNQISLIFSFSPQFYWIVVDFRFSTFTFHSKEIIIQSHLLTSESTSTELNLVICKIITYIVAIIIFQFKSFQSNKFDDIKWSIVTRITRSKYQNDIFECLKLWNSTKLSVSTLFILDTIERSSFMNM